MENIATYYPAIAECLVQVVRVIIMIIFGVLIIPWVKKNAIPWLKDKQLYTLICQFVRAAEKLGETGAITKEAKLDYVIGLLKRRGIEVTADVRAMIESAVGKLDDELTHGMMNLVDAIVNAEDIADMVADDDEIPFDEEDVSDDDDEKPAPDAE